MSLVTYSPKVFIPLTHALPRRLPLLHVRAPAAARQRAYMTTDEVLEVAAPARRPAATRRSSRSATSPSCATAARARSSTELGFPTTLEYLARCAGSCSTETGLLPHANPGVLDADELRALRAVSARRGSCSRRSSTRGSRARRAALRLARQAAGGAPRDARPRRARCAIPFTSGILIGIGETRAERVEALLALRESHERHGHLQEVIVQNFRAKPGTKMARCARAARGRPPLDDRRPRRDAGPRSRAGAAEPRRRRVPASCSRPASTTGAASRRSRPTTSTPRRRGPSVARLDAATRRRRPHAGAAPARLPAIRAPTSTAGSRGRRARRCSPPPTATAWRATRLVRRRPPSAPPAAPGAPAPAADLARSCARSTRLAGGELDEADVVALLGARGAEVELLAARADALRARRLRRHVTYVVYRNINYTNVCYFRCGFCAFSKGRLAANLRGPAVPPRRRRGRAALRARRGIAAPPRSACRAASTPASRATRTSSSCAAIRDALPDLHVHAFSPLEVWQGAATLGLPLADYLERLRDAGPRHAARHRGRDPRRRASGASSARTRSAPASGSRCMRPRTASACARRPRSCSAPSRGREAGRGTCSRCATCSGDGRLHRVRAAPVRAHGGADLAQGPRAAGPDVPRGACSCTPSARLVLHPWITNVQASWVKLGARRRARRAARRA